MGQDPRTDDSALTTERYPQEIRREIDKTRHELGDTVATLAEKADIKAQAKHRADATRESISHKRDELLGKAKSASPETAASFASGVSTKARANPVPLAAAAALAIGFLIGRSSRIG